MEKSMEKQEYFSKNSILKDLSCEGCGRTLPQKLIKTFPGDILVYSCFNGNFLSIKVTGCFSVKF